MPPNHASIATGNSQLDTIDPKLFVTVIMPIRNEAAFIECSLRSVLAQDYPHDCMEVLIADGMSSDNTRSLITALAKEYLNIPVHVIDNPGRIVPTGFNAAFAQSKGEIIIRVDGHCEIAPDYVSKCVEHLQKEQVQGVGGPIETIGGTPLSQTIALAMSSSFGVGGSPFRTIKDKTLLVDSVAFPAYTRQAIEMAGPLDEELVRNQDDEYNYRLRKSGGKILLASDVRSKYYSRGSLRSLWHQYYQYGFYKVRVLQKHSLQMRPRQFVPPLFVIVLIGGGVLALSSNVVAGLLTFTLALYATTNLFVSWRISRRSGWQHLGLLPIVFLILHFSYGLGFLAGLLRFWNRWRG